MMRWKNFRRYGFCLLALIPANEAAAIELVDNGHSQAVIVVAADAPLPEQTAAQELRKYISLMTGEELPVLNTPQPAGGNILVGDAPEWRQLLSGTAEDDQWRGKADSVIIRVDGDNVVLSGNRPRGTLYAVYTLLEKFWGVRWWSPTEEWVPEKATLSLPDDLTYRYAPPFFSRESHYSQINTNPEFAVKLKCNGHFQPIPENRGGHVRIAEPGYVHTITFLLPPERYFEAHPEWYVLDDRGVPAQVCWSNQAMIRELSRNVLEWLDRQPGAPIISVSQMDGWLRCECDQCKAMEAAGGSPAAPIIAAVNAVAEAVGEKYPDVLIETLAYCYSQAAPLKMKVHDNVLVRLCPYLNDFSRPYTDAANAAFAGDLNDWRQIAGKIAIWDYIANFSNYLIPHPNYGTFGDNLRLYAANNVVFVFSQGDFGSENCGDFIQLKAWVIAHLLWDPSSDERALMKEFLNGYYSPAAGEILLEVIDRCKAVFAAAGKPLGCYRANVNDWLPFAEIAAIRERFAAAERQLEKLPAAERAIFQERLRRARLPFDLVYLCAPQSSAWNPALGRETYRANQRLWAEVQAIYTRNRVERLNELDKIDVLYRRMPGLLAGPKYLRRSGDVPKFCTGIADADWYEFSTADFTLLKEGDWVTVEADASSPYGRAARLPNQQIWRLVQLPLSEFLAAGPATSTDTFEVYFSLRADGNKVADAPAAVIGVHDLDNDVNTAVELKFDELPSDRYRWFKLDGFAPGVRREAYVAPMTAGWQGNIWVDRIVVVRRAGRPE